MKRIHIALGVADVAASVADYPQRLGCAPDVIIPGAYALWQTGGVNFSIRRVEAGQEGLRHLGWEDDAAAQFQRDTDVNGIVWERFTADQQRREIEETWPGGKGSTT